MDRISRKLEKVEALKENYEYKLAFKLLDDIIKDKEANVDETTEALNLRGLLVVYAPYLTEYEEDETGLAYFIEAYHYNPLDVSVLFNILNSFTDHDMRQKYTQKNRSYFIKVYETLRNKL